MEKDFDAIDKMARDALNNLEVKFNPNDWDHMQDKLDGVDGIDNTFREALQSFSVAFNPSDWSQMENTLDEIYVDQSIKNALEGVEVPLNISHWAMMENTLDQIYIDQPVKDTLQNFEATFNPDDWAKMEEQLDRKKHLYPHIWLYKSIEAVVMGLILFTLFNFITKPSNSTYHKTNSTSKTNSGIVLNSTSDEVGQDNISQELQSNNVTENNNSQYPTGQALADANVVKNNTNSTSFNNKTTNNSLNENVDNKNLANANIGSTNNFIKTNNNSSANKQHTKANKRSTASITNNTNKNSKAISTKNSTKNNVSTNKNTLTDSNTENKQKQNIVAVAQENKNATTNNTKSITTKNSILSTTNSANTTTVEEQEQKDLVAETTKKRHNLTVLKTIDASKTKLVEDPIFELKKLEIPTPYIRQIKIGGLFSPNLEMNTSDGKGGIGYTFGLTLEADLFKKVSVRTGLIYSQKSYTLSDEKIVDNTSTDGARHLVLVDKTTNLFVLEIPLYAQYVFFQNEKWRVYATTGVSGNLIVGKEYTGTEKTEYEGVKMSMDINSQDYDEGLFKGGKFLDNAYMTVGGGIGIERQLGDQISLYLLPSYQHTITPIGINKDRVNTFSLSVGIKTTIR